MEWGRRGRFQRTRQTEGDSLRAPSQSSRWTLGSGLEAVTGKLSLVAGSWEQNHLYPDNCVHAPSSECVVLFRVGGHGVSVLTFCLDVVVVV